jgi:hypothetical protein
MSAALAPADTFCTRGVSGAVNGAQRDRWTRWLIGVPGDETHPFRRRLLTAKAAVAGGFSGANRSDYTCRGRSGW